MRRLLLSGAVVLAIIVAAVVLHSLRSATVRSESVHSQRSPANPEGVSREARKRILKTPTVTQTNSSINWSHEYETSDDYFDLASKAANRALEGDGRAALYVSKILGPCLVMARLYGNKADPELAFNQETASQPYPQLVDEKRKELRACRGFFKGDAFANLPPRMGGYNSPSYWRELAYQYDDPVAQTLHAASAIGSPLSPKPGGMEVAQSDINKAITSGDPEALFRAGFIISNGLSVDPIQGYAFSIAACDLGYDCSASNSDNVFFSHCVTLGTCQAGSMFSDVVTKAVGDQGYARAYERAKEIENALEREDAQTLQKFAQLTDPGISPAPSKVEE